MIESSGGGVPPGGGGWGPPGGGGYGPPPGGGGYGPPPGGGGGYGPPPGGGGGYGPPPGGGGGYGPPPGGGGGYGPPPGGGGGYGQPPGGGGYGQPPGGGFGAPPPGQGYPPPGGFAPPPAGGPPGQWSPTEAVGTAWQALTKDFAGIALPIAVALVLMEIPAFVMSFVQNFVQRMMASDVASMGGATQQTVLAIGFGLLSYLVGLLSQSFFLGGIYHFTLSVMRGQKPPFGEVFSGGRYFGGMLVSQLLFSLALLFGLALCIVPGVIVGLGCQFYALLVVDKNLTAVDALKESWRLTTGHKLQLFVLGLLFFGIVLAGLIACCIGALVVSAPLVTLAATVVYMKLSGEEPRPAA